MRRFLAVALPLAFLACATSGRALFPGRYAVEIDQNNGEAIAANEDPEDLEVTLRSAFASRFESVDFFPAARDQYDAIVSVRLNFVRTTPNGSTGERPSRIGLQYDLSDLSGTFATGFVPLGISEWPLRNATSDRIHSLFSSASEQLAERVLQDLRRRQGPRGVDH